MKEKLFGASSEKSSKDYPEQMALFNEAEAEANPEEEEPSAEIVKGYIRQEKKFSY